MCICYINVWFQYLKIIKLQFPLDFLLALALFGSNTSVLELSFSLELFTWAESFQDSNH